MKRKTRREIPLDKVAMVSLPLLLLVFVLWNLRPKRWFSSAVNLPESTLQISDSEGDYANILLKNGKCALVLDSELRAPVLKEMSKKYSVELSKAQIDKFSNIEVAGAAMKEIGTFINVFNKRTERIDERFGIPIDGANNELSDWLETATRINQVENSGKLKMALYCDKNESYANVRAVKNALSKIGIFRISIIYTPRR